MVEIGKEKNLICYECGNNLCLMDPQVFLMRHLRGEEAELYHALQGELNRWLFGEMVEYRLKVLHGG